MLQRLKSSKQRKRNTPPATRNINKTTTKQGASSDDHTKAKVAAHNKRGGIVINSKPTDQSKETRTQENAETDTKPQRTALGNEKTTFERNEKNSRIKATQVEDYLNCDERRALPQVQKNKPVNKKQKPFPIFGHAGCVLCILQDTWKNKILCDITLKVAEVTFEAHRLVLSSCAGYFYDLFCCKKRNKAPTITITDISPDTMELLLESMYTGQLKISERNIMDIIMAARQLRYFTVEQACDEYMQSLVTRKNCYSYLEFAVEQQFHGLAETCMGCIAKHFKDLAKGPKYLNLNIDQTVSLLSRDDLDVDTELEVFRRMLDWINCDLPKRLGYCGELLRQVRLPLMPASDIIDHVENTSYLMEVEECRLLVKEALHYHCLPARQSVLQNSRTRHRSIHQTDVVFAIGGAPKLLKDPVSDEITAYNPKSNQWEFVTKLPKPIHHHGVAVLGGFIYVVGGESQNNQKTPINKAYRFDPRTGSWLKIADMKKARESFQLCALTNMLYAIGGRIDQESCLTDVERYNPSVDAWETVAPLTSPRRAMAATSLNGRIYIAGGTGDPMKFERYNALNDSWETRQSLSESRFFAQLAAVHKSLYLLGGATVGESGVTSGVTSIQSYCPTSDTWTTLDCKLDSRAEAGCAVMGNKIYIVGGFSWNMKERLKSTHVYDVQTDSVEVIGEIAVPLTGIGCCATTICDLSLKKRMQESGEAFVENECNTCNFYHHCSQSSCNLDTGKSQDKSQANQDVALTKKTTEVECNSKSKKKKSKAQNKMPRITQNSNGTKYAERYRLTRAISCEPPSTKCGRCGNYPEPKLKLPKLIPETKAIRE